MTIDATTTHYTITIQYGTDKARHFGKYTTTRANSQEEAIEQAHNYFAKRNRRHLKVTRVQAWNPAR